MHRDRSIEFCCKLKVVSYKCCLVFKVRLHSSHTDVEQDGGFIQAELAHARVGMLQQ
jgi:hypothetical protein